MNKQFSKDPVDILMTKLKVFYDVCKMEGEKFEGKNEFEIVKEILDVVETNNRKQTVLKLVK